MTIERLEQYADLRKEVADLKKRRDAAAARSYKHTHSIANAVVQGSSTVFPYQSRAIIVKGYGVRKTKICKILEKQYARKESKALAEVVQIEEWLDTVRESKIRRLVRYHYIDGLTWAKTAVRVYGHPCEDAARKYVERFFEKI